MQSWLGKRRGLPVTGLLAFVRLGAGIALVAALLGRSTSEPAVEAAPRQPAHPRYLGTDGDCLDGFPGKPPVLLDTETGALVPCPIAGMGQFGALGCSPWRDGAGRYHFAGVACEKATGSHALVRSTFPAGRVLDQVKIDVLPLRQPCWFPDGSERILFAGTDCRLYVFDFAQVRRAGRSDPAPPRALRWEVEPPGVSEGWIRDPCWPGAPALGGRLIVALNRTEDASRRKWTSQLWWLQLSPECDAIVGAERAIGPEALGSSQVPLQELLPSVGITSDGTPVLAYLAENQYHAPLELRVSPIAPAASDRGPRVLRSEGRKLAEGCASVLPAFSADGRWIYAWRWVERKLRQERLAVPILTDATSVPPIKGGPSVAE